MLFALLATLAAVAQDTPVPVTLGVATIEAESGCPDVPKGAVPGVLRTSVGVMFARTDGAYTYGCSSRWGGDDDAQVAARPDRTELLFLGDAGVFRSLDGGCTASPLELPEGLVGRQVLFWRDGFYVLANVDGGVGGALLSLGSNGLFALATWTTFTPDGIATGGADTLWVAGAKPSVEVRRLQFSGGLSGDTPMPNLPPDVVGVQVIEPRAADDDEAWFVLERSTTQWTWHAVTVSLGGTTQQLFDTVEPIGRFVAGPAKLKNRWIAVIDNELRLSEQLEGKWTSTGTTVPWTCLQNVGDHVFACDIDDTVLVDGVGASGDAPTSTPVFSFLQVAPPDSACADAACTEDWTRVGGALGVLDQEEPAICPDGRTLTDLDATECTCASGGASATWPGALALLLGLRRRQSPRPRST